MQRNNSLAFSLNSPSSSEVHEKVTVVDPRHPDQLLILGNRLAARWGERLQLWELGLIQTRDKHAKGGSDDVTVQTARKLGERYQRSAPCHQCFLWWQHYRHRVWLSAHCCSEGKAPASLWTCVFTPQNAARTLLQSTVTTQWDYNSIHNQEWGWGFVTHLVTGSHSDLSLCAVQSPERRQRTDGYKFLGHI